MNAFQAPERTIGTLSPELAAQLITVAADLALVLDRKGIIRDVAFGVSDLRGLGNGLWLHQPLVEVVTIESRPKVLEMLEEALAGRVSAARELNHMVPGEADLPVRYSLVPMGRDGRILAMGRDLRHYAELQQRVLRAQLALERDYTRLRQAETRYRQLFQLASEAILILDGQTLRVTDANPAAAIQLGLTAGDLIGRAVGDLFREEDRGALQDHLASVRAMGRAESVRLTPVNPDAGGPVLAVGSFFRQDQSAHVLLRLRPRAAPNGVEPRAGLGSQLIDVVRRLPEGFVVTDREHGIIEANAAFLQLAELTSLEEARGERIQRFLGRPGLDTNVLMATLRENGTVHGFNTVVRGAYGAVETVDVTAVAIRDDPPCHGFVLRPLRDMGLSGRRRIELPQSVEKMTELVGRVPLKDLVRETTDVIERLCIEAALKLTGDNRASAAQLLGVSRQSLYSKLRRFGLSDGDSDDES